VLVKSGPAPRKEGASRRPASQPAVSAPPRKASGGSPFDVLK